MSNRTFLRAETTDHHMQAEAMWSTDQGFADLATYRRWLTAMYGVHTRYGLSSARRLQRVDLVEEERARLAALVLDLELTGSDEGARYSGSESWAWGVQYVLNGSAMGASILLKSGSVGPTWPTRYLRQMQNFAKSGALKAFFDAVDAVHLDRGEALKGARMAFPLQIMDLT